ncbi:nitroreductase [Rubrivivax gelatinosus]|uniref:Putative NAD(P)H nitroreductase n=1 Tax=Rubrivivax gelatinosus TaxID=28068 RepID=A0ABS1DTX4_RUBGE|nr:nitroreductase family protein [Rubrivivax gelatinosus]MBK1614259.1 nitroreductase [Rubrivivax gelatinosus]MBK1713451.1 nitroreductase [Rubrivivax gelatinosus]
MNTSLQLLLTRHSLGAKHLVDPAPDDAALNQMAEAALHAPDHGELVPYRFVVVRGAARERLAAAFTAAALRAGKDEAGAALDAERAARPPVTVALLARLDLGHPQVPAHEQWIAVGAALANYLNAAHALGFAGKMLSGAKVRDAGLQAAFCGPGETLVGWVVLGTPARPPSTRAAKAAARDIWQDWTE